MTIIQSLILFLVLLALLICLWFRDPDTRLLNTLLVWALIILFIRLVFFK